MPQKESAAARAVRAAARAASVESPTTPDSTFCIDLPIMPPALRLKYDVGAVIGKNVQFHLFNIILLLNMSLIYSTQKFNCNDYSSSVQ